MQQHKFTGWAQTWHDELNTKHRLLAIRKFAKAIVDPVEWKQKWDEAGGTNGILRLLSLASVNEVKAFCGAIRASNRRGKKSKDRESAVEELVAALMPQHYPSTDLRTHDKRPLQKYYGRMLRGCSSDFVLSVLDTEDGSNPLFQNLNLRKLLFAHEEMLKRRLTNYLIHDGPELPEDEVKICFTMFVFCEPPLPGTQPNMSASMEFGLELLQARTTLKCTANRWPHDISELEVWMSIYRRLAKKSRSADKSSLISLGLRLVGLNPKFKFSSDAGKLWDATVTLWKKHPRQYEEMLSQGIKLGIPGYRTTLSLIATRWKEDPDQYEQILVQSLREGVRPEKKISEDYLRTVKGMSHGELSPELRWRLLRLYCQHSPQKGVDIETSSDFMCLADQEWSFEIVDKLERERAILFLSNLYKVNPNFAFLRAPDGYKSIYSNSIRQSNCRNFNVEIILISYQAGDINVLRNARDEVDQLRRKAAASPKQEDRAFFAKASAYCAIATSDLEVYAETTLWQQRFIRDPLTVQSVFGPDAILTSEGVALLSGIALSLREDTTLNLIGKQIAIANKILESFNDAKKIATKEPSYKQLHWKALQSIYSDVYRERVSRIKKIKLQPNESELDLFRIIWGGTTDLVHSIGSDFLSQVSGHIRDLLIGFSGVSLIAASETLLDFAAKLGEKADRNKDQDNMVSIMEQLAYQVISSVAHSNAPMLAQDLIRRVIIEHPEASSWHRQFLSIGYMRELPAEGAKAMLLSFAAAIGEKLEEQSYVKVGEAEPAPSAPPRSLVKVTTVKYLAQMLNDADFISPDSAIEVLIEMFKSATHIDIRLATLDSLFSTLNAILSQGGEQWRSNPTVEQVLSTLDRVVSIAGNINERRPLSATDWTEAEEKVIVPAPSDNSNIPPLFAAILNATQGNQYPGLKKLQGELFSRLILPVLRQSQEQHRRWFSLFLAKHRPSLGSDSLPQVPITPRIWRHLLNHYGHLLPLAIINEYSQYMLLQLRLPQSIEDLNKVLQKDANLRNDGNVAHWLSIFGDSKQSQSWANGIHSLLDLIRAPIEKVSQTSDLIDIVVSQASVLLDGYEGHMGQWSYLVSSLGTAHLSKNWKGTMYDKAWTRWREETPSLAKRLVTLIEQKADSMTAQNHVMLPSSFPLRLCCLPFPDPKANEKNQDFRDLTVELDQSLVSFLKSYESRELFWTTLVDETFTALHSIYTTNTSRLRVAVQFGDLDFGPERATEPVVQLIKVALALKIIDHISGQGALRKPRLPKDLTPEKSKIGELVKKLRVVMDRWIVRPSPYKQQLWRDMVLQWKTHHKVIWEDICSWDATPKVKSESS